MGENDWGKLGLIPMGKAKTLIQFSIDGQHHVPSLPLLRPNYGRGEEDNGDLLQKVLLVKLQKAQLVKILPAVQETCFQFLGWEGPLEKEMATHSNILIWRIPWTEEPGRLQSMGSQESDTT